jgi:hypothetical protein
MATLRKPGMTMRNTEINKFKFSMMNINTGPTSLHLTKWNAESSKTGDKAEISRLRSSTSGTSSGNARSWTWAQ